MSAETKGIPIKAPIKTNPAIVAVMRLLRVHIKEVPDGPGRVQIIIRFADKKLGQILITPGPGVAAAPYFVQDNVSATGALPIGHFMNAGPVLRIIVGY